MKAICIPGIVISLTSPALFSNIIADPGFESGTSTYLWGGSSVVNSNQRTGTYCAKLGENTTWGGGYEQTFTGLLPNASYTFSAYVKTMGGAASIGVKNHGSAQSAVSFDSSTYILREITFMTGASSTSATCFVWNSPGSATVVYLDDLSLVGETAPEVAFDLIFSDEFNTAGPIDLNKWEPEVGFKRNNETQYYRAENLSQSGGNLVVTAKREQFPNPNYEPGSSDWRLNREYASWTSGSINTADSFDFLYGRIECRAKVTNLTGTWPAIWTVGGGEWPATGEIDIMENYRGKILANFAYAGNGRWTAVWDSASVYVSSFPAGWANSYHVWELDWSPDRAFILLDGVVINTFNPATKNLAGAYAYPGQAPFQTFGQILWLNLAIGGAGGSTAALPDETVYLVDYIRVYQGKVAVPKLSLEMPNPTDLNLEFDTLDGRRYSIYESENLTDWSAFVNKRGTGQSVSHTRVIAPDVPRMFYTAPPDNSPMIDPDTPRD
jgi:beta-glucanase (GH16 family)